MNETSIGNFMGSIGKDEWQKNNCRRKTIVGEKHQKEKRNDIMVNIIHRKTHLDVCYQKSK